MRAAAFILALGVSSGCLYDVRDPITDGGTTSDGDVPLDGGQGGDADAPFVCSATVCGTDCADLMTDGKHCGTCAHDCEGGVCVAGVCKPIAIAPAVGASRMAIDPVNVYWISNGSIMACALAGCANNPTVLASNQSSPYGLAANGTNVYWTNEGAGTVARCAVGGCMMSPTVIATGLGAPRGIALDTAYVYWVNSGNATVVRCPLAGCGTPMMLSSGPNAPLRGIAVDSAYVHWTGTSPGAVSHCALGGGSATSISSGTSPFAIASDGATVFWSNINGSGNEAQAIMRASTVNFQATPLVGGQGGTYDIAFDAANVYWTSGGNNTVMAIPKAGGSPITIASNQNQVAGIAVDAKRIFWAANGLIIKLVKP